MIFRGSLNRKRSFQQDRNSHLYVFIIMGIPKLVNRIFTLKPYPEFANTLASLYIWLSKGTQYLEKDFFETFNDYQMDLMVNKSDVKRRITLGCLDQYTCKGLRPWSGPGISPPPPNTIGILQSPPKQGVFFHLWSKFGDPSLNVSRFIARTT